ncbi:MAG: DUF3152 domain-containing protein [Acidimicrobiales bacterium]
MAVSSPFRRTPGRAFAALTALALLVGVIAAGGAAGALPAERTITYSVRGAGTTAADLDTFAAVAGRTLDDPRGWSMVGRVRFQPVAAGGQFTLWLASGASLEQFSPVCSTEWSCRVGDDVIINGERWSAGAPGWTLSLDEYRNHVINHEVGHWLGLGHVACPAAGRPAPVMMQQSKGLDGCTANVWPLDRELAAAARRLGLPLGGHAPIGDLNSIAIRSNDVSVFGWAIDPDQVGPVVVELRADGRTIAGATAAQDRPDVAAAYPLYGAEHGFSFSADVPLDTGQLCVVAIDATGDGETELGCRRGVEQPIGALDRAWVVPGGYALYGWALDPDIGDDPVQVHLYADGSFVTALTADRPRRDVPAQAPGFGPAHGWEYVGAGRPAEVCAWALDDRARPPKLLGCSMLEHDLFGRLDAVQRTAGGAALYGWAVDPDTVEPVTVHLYDGPTFLRAVRADQARADVGDAYPAYGPAHGFAVTLDQPLSGALCAYAIDDDGDGYTPLGCG